MKIKGKGEKYEWTFEGQKLEFRDSRLIKSKGQSHGERSKVRVRVKITKINK